MNSYDENIKENTISDQFMFSFPFINNIVLKIDMI